MAEPIIVGVDPGTTSAYSVMDISGKLIKIYSSKNLGLNEIVKQISQLGNPILLGTDKAKIPDLVEKLGASFGCKIYSPKQDYKANEKKKLADKYNYNDTHQMDCLAAGIFAYNSIVKLIEKIKAKKYQKENELIILVVKYGMSIRGAIKYIEMPKQEKIQIKKVIEKKEFSKRDYVLLLEKFNDLSSELDLVRKQSKKLLIENKKVSKEIDKLKGKKIKIDTKRIDSLFVIKEKRIKEMQKKLEDKNEEIALLNNSMKDVDRALLKVKDSYLLRRVKNLLSDVKVSKDEMLFVDNPTEYNQQVVSGLKGKINVIVCLKQSKKLPFHFVKYEDKLEEIGSFVLVNRKKLDLLLEQKDVFSKIITDYQNRETL